MSKITIEIPEKLYKEANCTSPEEFLLWIINAGLEDIGVDAETILIDNHHIIFQRK